MTTPSRRVHGASTGSQIIKLTNALYNKKLYVQEFYPNTNSVSIAHTLSHSNHCPPCIISLSPFSLSPTSLSLLLHLIVTLFPTTIDPLTSSPAMGEGYGASTCMRQTLAGMKMYPTCLRIKNSVFVLLEHIILTEIEKQIREHLFLGSLENIFS